MANIVIFAIVILFSEPINEPNFVKLNTNLDKQIFKQKLG